MIQHTQTYQSLNDEQVLEALRRAKASAEAVRARLREPLAIVGIGCRFPQAENPEAFWRLLQAGRDAVTATPQDRSQPTTIKWMVSDLTTNGLKHWLPGPCLTLPGWNRRSLKNCSQSLPSECRASCFWKK